VDGERDFDKAAERDSVQGQGRWVVKLILLGLGIALLYLGYTGKYKDVASILGVAK
jgi:hypothetical protein